MTLVSLQRRGPVGLVTLNRPDRLNAISRALTCELHALLTEANEDPMIGVIVFTGEGRAFCAGDDLKEFDQQTQTPEAIVEHIASIQAITRDLMFSDKIVVGAAHGFAVGGGFEWLLNCDLVVAAHDLVCFLPEMELGQFVTGGLTHLLPLAVGHQRAMELIVLGERLSAADLRQLGLVNFVVPRDRLMSRAMEVAENVASKSRFSVSTLKKLIVRDLSPVLERALALEQEATVAAFKTAEAAERAERFKKRR